MKIIVCTKKKILVIIGIIAIILILSTIQAKTEKTIQTNSELESSNELQKELNQLEKAEEKVAYLTFDDGPTKKSTPKILDILKEAMPKVDWENGEDLVDDGVIDSMDVVTIISEITDAYDIEIPSEEMEPENFNSAKAIYEMIQRLEEE